MESFQITTNGKKIDTYDESDGDTSDGSEISISDESYNGEEEDHTDVLNFLSNAFVDIANVSSIGYREFQLIFETPNVSLKEEEIVESFDIDKKGIPILSDPAYFLQFVSFLKEKDPSLMGVTLQTNLEGGGYLII